MEVQANNPQTQVKPGYYIDPQDNMAIRSPAGSWSVWAVDESGKEDWRWHPNPRLLDSVVSILTFIEDL